MGKIQLSPWHLWKPWINEIKLQTTKLNWCSFFRLCPSIDLFIFLIPMKTHHHHCTVSLRNHCETQRMGPGWAMAIIGPIGTLILCELSKVGSTDPRSRWLRWMCRWFLVGSFVWSKNRKKNAWERFWVNKKRPFFGFVFLVQKHGWFHLQNQLVIVLVPLVLSAIGLDRCCCGSFHFWKCSFLGGSQKLVGLSLLRHTWTRACWIGLVWVH